MRRCINELSNDAAAGIIVLVLHGNGLWPRLFLSFCCDGQDSKNGAEYEVDVRDGAAVVLLSASIATAAGGWNNTRRKS